ncbi:MAG: ADP-ribosylglycohydrolase family protein [Akkermansiaceae bacterium]
MPQNSDHLKTAGEILEGVALGDAFGELYSYYAYEVRERVALGLVDSTWRYTDDTIMSLGILECLARLGEINQDVLAWIFGRRFNQDPDRGYGKMARRTLKAIANGESWELHTKQAFQGGSMGNGAAMRATPIGVWFRHDYQKLIHQAKLSAQVTHWHPEGQLGAVAVALATAEALNTRHLPADQARTKIAQTLRDHLEDSEIRITTLRALEMQNTPPLEAARELGAGQQVLAQDTVPFAIWCALHSPDNYQEAILCAVEPNGDCDTVAAITGGIVTARLGKKNLPPTWLKHREPIIYQPVAS